MYVEVFKTHLYLCKVRRKHIMIPVNRETKSLITIRGMRKNEKQVYQKEFGND
jgi:hypothetical protein